MKNEIKIRKKRFWAAMLALLFLLNQLPPIAASANSLGTLTDGQILLPGETISNNTETSCGFTYLGASGDILASGDIAANGSHVVKDFDDTAPVGSEFSGWTVLVNYITGGGIGSIVLQPQFKEKQYTITFDTAGGSSVESIVGTAETPVTAPANPTKTGYTFAGWDKEIPATMPAENITITAQWKVNQYTITFDTAGGSAVGAITGDYGTAVTAPADPTRENYVFDGWDTEIPATMPAENMTITAKWTEKQYTITFDTAGGSSVESIVGTAGTPVTAPANPTKTGYTFAGWDKNIPSTMPAENTTITAQWTANQYTITFDTDGGSVIDPITQSYGTTITAPGDPTMENYYFMGWDKDIPATMPAEDMTITAKWTPKVIDAGSTWYLEAGKEYQLGSAKTVDNDSSTYADGITFFVSQSGTYSFS